MILYQLKIIHVITKKNYNKEKDFIYKIMTVLIKIYQLEHIKNIIKIIRKKYKNNTNNIMNKIKNK